MEKIPVSYTHLDVYKRQDLTQVVETYQDYKHSMEALEEAKELLKEEDKEIKEMAKMEIEELEPKIEEYLGKLEILLIPKDQMCIRDRTSAMINY